MGKSPISSIPFDPSDTEDQSLRSEAHTLRTEAQNLRSEAQALRSEAQTLRSEAETLGSEAQSRRSETQTSDLKDFSCPKQWCGNLGPTDVPTAMAVGTSVGGIPVGIGISNPIYRDRTPCGQCQTILPATTPMAANTAMVIANARITCNWLARLHIGSGKFQWPHGPNSQLPKKFAKRTCHRQLTSPNVKHNCPLHIPKKPIGKVGEKSTARITTTDISDK